MALALVSVLAVAALAAALFLLTSRNDLRRKLAEARSRSDQLDQQLAAATAQLDERQAQVEENAAARDRAAAELEAQRQRADELAVLLEAATTSPTDEQAAGLWHLLLAHVTRRWAAVVGVPPDGRTLTAGPPSGQLVEALARETERLREEVGVDVEIAVPEVAVADDAADPVRRVAVLVAALELLGVLATSAQRVAVEVGESLVITGDGWVDPYGELSTAYDRVAAAGVDIDPLQVDGEQVRLVVHRAAT